MMNGSGRFKAGKAPFSDLFNYIPRNKKESVL